jgi:hypothetical protein
LIKKKHKKIKSFEKLIEKYKDYIFNLLVHILGNLHDAEDVAQETFIKAFKNFCCNLLCLKTLLVIFIVKTLFLIKASI